MKTPNLQEKALEEIPEGYSLHLQNLYDMLEQTGAPLSDRLLFAISGAYKWGFERGRRAEANEHRKAARA